MQRDARAISAERNAVELQAVCDSVMVLSELIEVFFHIRFNIIDYFSIFVVLSFYHFITLSFHHFMM